MSSKHNPIRSVIKRSVATFAACVAVAAGLVTYGLSAAGAATTTQAGRTFTFGLEPSPGIAKCLPHAHGLASITPGSLNDTMKVTLYGMPANSDFDLFVIQTPNKGLVLNGSLVTRTSSWCDSAGLVSQAQTGGRP
jgi:hypothetical protein